MKNLTEMVFILDRSGSMAGLESDTIGGFNSMLKKQQTEIEGKTFVSTILFDHESLVLHDRLLLSEVKSLTEKDYEVRGSTALLDAVGDAINHVKKIHKYISKYADEEHLPEKTLFVITTDSMENSSVKYDYNQIKRLIEQQKEYGWEFIFLGANIDAVEVASHIGIDARRDVNYHADSKGTAQVFRAVGDLTNAFSAMPAIEMEDFFSAGSWHKSIDNDFKDRKKDAE